MSPRQSAFAANGFVVLRQFLRQPEVAQLEKQLESLVREGREGGCTRPNNTLLPLRWDDEIVQLILHSKQRIAIVCDAVSADDLRWISGYISTKEARSAPLAWHQDWWCWSHRVTYRRAAPQIAVLSYITATNSRDGALRVLPGSHARNTRLHSLLPDAHDQTSSALEPGHPALSDQPQQATLA